MRTGREHGVDYDETFAKMTSVRCILSIAAVGSSSTRREECVSTSQPIREWGDLKEEVYMRLPPGFMVDGNRNLVCRLKKAIYGLKQAPRAWFDRFRSLLSLFGFRQSAADSDSFLHTSPLLAGLQLFLSLLMIS